MAKTSREHIVATAASLFGEKGYDATSLADIAEEVGILKGSLYHHISSKNELLLEIAGPPIATMLLEIREIAARAEAAPDRLLAAVANHLRHLDSDFPYIFGYLQERFGVDRSDMNEMSREYQRVLESIIRDRMGSGEFRSDLPPRLATFYILGACNWMQKWYQPDREWSIESIQKQFSSLFLDGMSTPVPPHQPRGAVRTPQVAGDDAGAVLAEAGEPEQR